MELDRELPLLGGSVIFNFSFRGLLMPQKRKKLMLHFFWDILYNTIHFTSGASNLVIGQTCVQYHKSQIVCAPTCSSDTEDQQKCNVICEHSLKGFCICKKNQVHKQPLGRSRGPKCVVQLSVCLMVQSVHNHQISLGAKFQFQACQL